MVPNRRVRVAIALGAVMSAGLPLVSEAQAVAEADLGVTVEAPAQTTVGSSLAFEIAVSNGGPDAEPEAALEVTLPEGMVLASVGPEAGACDEGPPVTCSLGEIAPGETLGVTLEASPVEPGTLESVAMVSGAVAVAGDQPDETTVQVQATGQPCTITGTEDDEVLVGTEGSDVICGLGGDDVLRGLGGNDELLGGAGADTADFSTSPRSVRVDLEAGTALGDGVDALADIENVMGSPHGDLIKGSGVDNTLQGLGGDDVLFGSGGDDTLEGEAGGDFLDGGPGSDLLDGGVGPDTCLVGPDGGTTAACEATPNPSDPRDTRGRLDLRRIRGPVGGSRLTWTLKTRSRWTPRSVWDKGYLVVWIDARGGPEPDHLAVIRAKRKGLIGRLFRINATGRERQIGTVKASKRGKRGAAVRVALHKVNVGDARFSYRWSAQTMFTGRRCARVCLDSAPAPVQMFLRPLPGA